MPTTPIMTLPFPTPPQSGGLLEVSPGILWLRLSLPFRLDHVNVYLIEDGAGFAVVDTGIGDDITRAAWEALLAGPLALRPLTRIIVTHYHPDHVGMAGWLCERLGAKLLMSQTEYLTSLTIQLDPHGLDAEPYRSFYRDHGLDAATTEGMLTNGQRYLRMITGLPRAFHRIIAGETLQIGGRRFAVLTGGGHAPEQVMLYSAEDKLLLAADQVLARITPNISVQAMDPEGDPLGIYLRSLHDLKETVGKDCLVLPGHDLPFVGLHARIDQLFVHHQSRCAAILAACQERALTAAELIPVVFSRPISDPHQMGFAFSEALAHANLMLRQGAITFGEGRFHAPA